MEGGVHGLIISAFAGKTEKNHERVSHISRYPNTKECYAMRVYYAPSVLERSFKTRTEPAE